MAKKPLLVEQLIFFHWFSSLRLSRWESSLGGKKKPHKIHKDPKGKPEKTKLMKEEMRQGVYLQQNPKRYWSIAHTSGRQTQISCHNSSDAEGHAGSSSIKYNLHPEQPDEIWETELWIPTRDTCSWFIFLISYSPTNCAISSWRWVGNNWTAKLWFTQPIKESWDGPLDKSFSFLWSSWARTTFSSDNMAKITMTQLTLRI